MALSEKPVQTAAGSLKITMSGGLLRSLDWGLRPVEDILSKVDAALYEAKSAGRNCIRMAIAGKSEQEPVLSHARVPTH